VGSFLKLSQILSAMQKIAIFGGTFNPVHWGHLQIAEVAVRQKALDQVLWVTAHPRYKGANIVEFRHRQSMVKLAIATHSKFVLCPEAANQSSYAIDTYLALQACYPNCEWYSIVGLDAFRSLPRWYRSLELAPQCHWLVARRAIDGGGNPEKSIEETVDYFDRQGVPLRWEQLEMPCLEISSSLVRQYCRDLRSIYHLVPPAVETYIQQQGLYLSAL
jgi:nicotinate-nucleotide adenylyltransferase